MLFTETQLKGVFVIELEKREDERGFFARVWCKNEFVTHGLDTQWVQANVAFTKNRATVRGLHYQLPPYQEAKLVRCIKGAIFDVALDLRPCSGQFRQWIGVELSETNQKALYIPKGFAHGYQTLTNNVQLLYFVSQFYALDYERGVRWDDPTFNIAWPEIGETIVSKKDRRWPDFRMPSKGFSE